MRLAAHNPTPSPPAGGSWRRYGGAVVVAVAVNAAVVGLLSKLNAPRGRHAEAARRAIPLTLVEPSPAPPEATVMPKAESAEPAPPVMPSALPAPPMPQPILSPPRIPTPALPPLRAPADCLRVPAFAARVDAPAPLPAAAPASLPAVLPTPPARPGAPRGGERGPVCLEPPDLSAYYPRRARLRGTTGRTTVRVTIDATGQVADVQVVRSTPEGVFDQAAARVARSLRFLPARRDDKPVATTVSMNLVWKLE